MSDNDYLSSLGALMRKNDTKGIAALQNEMKSKDAETFVRYMDRKISASEYSRTQLAQRAGLSRDYCFKVLRGEKHVTERDYIIALCLAAKFNLYETQKALTLYPFPELDVSDNRSALIMAALNNGLSMDELNEVLEADGLALIKISPEMPSAKIIPLRSTDSEFDMVESFTERGTTSQNRKGDNTMENQIRVKVEQMGCMPCDKGIIAEKCIEENGEPLFITASATPEGDFYTVCETSYYDYDADYDDFPNPIEDYDSFSEALTSKYYMHFVEVENQLNLKVAEYRHQHDNT